MNLESLSRLLQPLSVRISNLIGHAVIKGADDAKKVQELQVELLPGEVRDEIEHFQGYGFTSVPLEGAEAVVIFVGGRRDQGYCIGTDDRRHRPTGLEPGEVAVYNNAGAKVVLKANGDIEVSPKPGQKLKIASDVEVTGTVTASIDVVGGGKSLKTHVHSATLTVATTGTAAAQSGTATGNTGSPT